MTVTEARYILELLGSRLEQAGELYCAAHQGRLAIVLLHRPSLAEFEQACRVHNHLNACLLVVL